MGRAFKIQVWVALLDVESEPTRVDPRLDPSLGGGEGGIKVQKHAPSMVSMPMCPGGSQTTFKTFVCERDESQSLPPPLGFTKTQTRLESQELLKTSLIIVLFS